MMQGASPQRYSEPEARTILSVSAALNDHDSLKQILTTGHDYAHIETRWELVQATNLLTAYKRIRDLECPAVICERELPRGNWKDLLNYTQGLANPPLVIVASLHADEYLWAEALNLGAYDVVRKPFDRTEIIRVITSACLRWHRDRGRPVAKTILRRAAAGI